MSTYTNNNNTINYSSIQGPKGTTGYSGSVGPQGATGATSTVDGPQGQPALVRTDISFSGAYPYRLIKEGKIRFVGSFVFNKQVEVRTAAATAKVLVSAYSETSGDVEIGLCLNGNKTDSSGETRIAIKEVMVSGTGLPQDATIVELDRISSTIINDFDTISLWAYIKPTQGEMNNVISQMAADADVTPAQATYYINETYIRPYDMSTPDPFYWALLEDYNIKNTEIPGAQVVQMQNTLQTYIDSIDPDVSLPAIEENKLGTLKVHYLQIL